MFVANTYNIFIASPGDVKVERDEAQKIINNWNGVNAFWNNMALLPLRWEDNVAPGMEKDGQSIINEKLLDRTDLLIAIFWSRIGSPTPRSKSATVEEIEYHIKNKKPAMIFFSTRFPIAGYDIEQYEELKKLKKEYYAKGLVKEFGTIEDFKEKFAECLQLKLNENKNIFSGFSIESGESQIIGFENLSEEAIGILTAMSENEQGTIMVTNSKSGVHIQIGNTVLFQGQNIREIVKWESAIKLLEKYDQIEKKSDTHYTITANGLKNADSQKKEQIPIKQDESKPRFALALQWAHGYRANKGLSNLNKFSGQPIHAENALWSFEISNRYNLILKNVSNESAWNIEIVDAEKIFDTIQKLPPLASLKSGEEISSEVEFLQYYNGFGLDADKLPRIPTEKEGLPIIIKFENSDGQKFSSKFTLQDGKIIEE